MKRFVSSIIILAFSAVLFSCVAATHQESKTKTGVLLGAAAGAIAGQAIGMDPKGTLTVPAEVAASSQATGGDSKGALAWPAAGAAASDRYALVIGNASYKGLSLKNPANDAEDMATALRGSIV